jgi:hypothetical protein
MKAILIVLLLSACAPAPKAIATCQEQVVIQRACVVQEQR